MKRQKIITIAALVHLILWSGALLFYTFATVYGELSGTANALTIALLFMVTFFVGVGFLNALLLFFSVRNVYRPASAEKRPLQKIALIFSAVATVWFYAFSVLVMDINTGALPIAFAMFGILPKVLSVLRHVFAFLWLACTVTGSVLLCASAKET